MPLAPCIAAYVIQSTAWPPPPPAPPPPIVPGFGPYRNAVPSSTSLPTMTGQNWTTVPPQSLATVQVGDLLIAFMVFYFPGAPGGVTMVGNLPSGFTLVTEDDTQGLYVGIATKTAVTYDTIAADPGYSFLNPFATGDTDNVLGVGMVCVRGFTSGIDATQLTKAASNPTRQITADGVACAHANELVLVMGDAGTTTGAVETSSASGLERALAFGFADSSLSVFYVAGPASAGTSSSQVLTNNNFNTASPLAAYQVSIH